MGEPMRQLQVVSSAADFKIDEGLLVRLRELIVEELRVREAPPEHFHLILRQVQREMVIRELARDAEPEDLILVGEASAYAKRKCVHRKHHTVAMGTGSGKLYRSPNLITSRRREHSSCAETGLIHMFEADDDACLERLVVVHHKVGTTVEPQVVEAPCGGCAERLRTFAPDGWFILFHKGKYMKVQCKYFLLFAYPDDYSDRDTH